MPVEITRKYKPKTSRVVSARVSWNVDEEIWNITRQVGQTRAEFMQDAIADRLLYLQGYLNDKEDGHV